MSSSGIGSNGKIPLVYELLVVSLWSNVTGDVPLATCAKVISKSTELSGRVTLGIWSQAAEMIPSSLILIDKNITIG